MALQRITAQSADRICALLIGPAGIGKTSQIRCLLGQDFQNGAWVQSGFQPEKVLVLSAESGLLCVRDLVASGQVEGYEIRSLADFQEALRFCLSPDFRQAGYQWVFIDSLTEISARVAEDLQRKYPSSSDTLKLWGEYSQQMTDLVKAFRDLPRVNVVFTCLITVDKDKATGRVYPAPDISGSKLKSRLTSYFDEVLVMDRLVLNVGNPEAPTMQEVLVFNTKNPVGLAKDRSGKLAETEYPSLLAIRNKILG